MTDEIDADLKKDSSKPAPETQPMTPVQLALAGKIYDLTLEAYPDIAAGKPSDMGYMTATFATLVGTFLGAVFVKEGPGMVEKIIRRMALKMITEARSTAVAVAKETISTLLKEDGAEAAKFKALGAMLGLSEKDLEDLVK